MTNGSVKEETSRLMEAEVWIFKKKRNKPERDRTRNDKDYVNSNDEYPKTNWKMKGNIKNSKYYIP